MRTTTSTNIIFNPLINAYNEDKSVQVRTFKCNYAFLCIAPEKNNIDSTYRIEDANNLSYTIENL